MRSSYSFASRLVGDVVRNSAGASLGYIKELIMNSSTGRIDFAIIALDTIGGIEDRFAAVPWEAVSVAPGRDYVLLDMERITLERGPTFSTREWPDFTDPLWRSRVHNYYGVGDSAVPSKTVVVERRDYTAREGMSIWAKAFLFLVFVGLAGFLYLFATRGWEQAKTDMLRSFYDVGYAMKEDGTDAAITGKVKAALSLNKDLASQQISVNTDSRVVTLRGQVSDDHARAVAEKVAGDTPGVLRVDDELEVTSKR